MIHGARWNARNVRFGSKAGLSQQHHSMTALPPKTDTRIGTFGQTGTLGNLIDRPLPAVLSLFHGLPRGIPETLYESVQ
jgi:hypothetical protein